MTWSTLQLAPGADGHGRVRSGGRVDALVVDGHLVHRLAACRRRSPLVEGAEPGTWRFSSGPRADVHRDDPEALTRPAVALGQWAGTRATRGRDAKGPDVEELRFDFTSGGAQEPDPVNPSPSPVAPAARATERPLGASGPPAMLSGRRLRTALDAWIGLRRGSVGQRLLRLCAGCTPGGVSDEVWVTGEIRKVTTSRGHRYLELADHLDGCTTDLRWLGCVSERQPLVTSLAHLRDHDHELRLERAEPHQSVDDLGLRASVPGRVTARTDVGTSSQIVPGSPVKSRYASEPGLVTSSQSQWDQCQPASAGSPRGGPRRELVPSNRLRDRARGRPAPHIESGHGKAQLASTFQTEDLPRTRTTSPGTTLDSDLPQLVWTAGPLPAAPTGDLERGAHVTERLSRSETQPDHRRIGRASPSRWSASSR